MKVIETLLLLAGLNLAVVAWWYFRITLPKRRKLKENDKLDFCDWYKANKPEIMYRIRIRSGLIGVDLEAKIDEQYQLYLSH